MISDCDACSVSVVVVRLMGKVLLLEPKDWLSRVQAEWWADLSPVPSIWLEVESTFSEERGSGEGHKSWSFFCKTALLCFTVSMYIAVALCSAKVDRECFSSFLVWVRRRSSRIRNASVLNVRLIASFNSFLMKLSWIESTCLLFGKMSDRVVVLRCRNFGITFLRRQLTRNFILSLVLASFSAFVIVLINVSLRL